MMRRGETIGIRMLRTRCATRIDIHIVLVLIALRIGRRRGAWRDVACALEHGQWRYLHRKTAQILHHFQLVLQIVHGGTDASSVCSAATAAAASAAEALGLRVHVCAHRAVAVDVVIGG